MRQHVTDWAISATQPSGQKDRNFYAGFFVVGKTNAKRIIVFT